MIVPAIKLRLYPARVNIFPADKSVKVGESVLMLATESAFAAHRIAESIRKPRPEDDIEHHDNPRDHGSTSGK